MHLKRMELFGFKSFADKSELDLSPGITAIIGPNGCGKSNLVDAVRWALGEQSVKSLRGTRMEEIIFSGSEDRKALNFAEVSLTFAEADAFLNLDYDEITITRRLFRNGDSEYYINKSPCRLKDITELFLDTGLGKDVYSVIGQGRVDEIINSRPEERREIFEEAAGIFKYKMRKREARRRLDETRDNLVRVQDLIYELETQVEPLQGQAEVTRQYRELKQNIDKQEQKLLSFHLHESRSQFNKIISKLDAVNDALISAAAKSGIYEKELGDLKNTLQDYLREKREQEEKNNLVSRAIEKQENDLEIMLERENRYQTQLEQNEQRLKQLEQLIAEFEAQKRHAEEELAGKKDQLTELEKELTKLRRNLTEHENNSLALEVEKLQEETYQARNRKEAHTTLIEEINRRLERLHLQKNNALTDKDSLGKKREALKENIESLRAKLEKTTISVADAEKALANAVARENTSKAAVDKVNQELLKNREELHGLNSRLQLLKEQDAALSGYYRGVKEVLQSRSSLPGIIGPVADLISVDNQYIQALELALGGSLQYLVAETEKAVQVAIEFLKKGNRGWATFLPLDVLHNPADPLARYPGWRNLPGVIGKASELVDTDPANRKAIDYLMSSILVCRSLTEATKAARFVGYSCRIVTLDGETINPGGLIRGGSFPKRNASLPLGRRKEIETLEKQQSIIDIEMQKTEKNLKELQANLASAERESAELLNQKQALMEFLNSIQKEYEASVSEQNNLDDRYLAVEKIIKEIEFEEKELEQRISSAKEAIEESTRDLNKYDQELAAMKEGYRQFLLEKQALEQKATDLLVKISSCREQHEALMARIEEIDDNIKRPRLEITENEQESAEYRTSLEENRENQQNIKKQIQDYNLEKAALITRLEDITRQVGKTEADIIELEEEGRRRQNQVSRQEKRERQLSLEKTRLQTEINYQEMRYRELFKSMELLVQEEGFDPEESQAQIENLKEDLEGLGEVNLGAIEELSRLEDRINFLKEQKDDLQKGEASLNKVLAEIDQRMEYYFEIAFEKIKENFQQTFNELFEGGQVVLKLTDAEKVLDSGIEIVAQPPGKKLQNITLLSAGEKVLTAIALVFAILRFKPAPFYLLDEVESTLDDANLGRFNRFLLQSTKQAQFIMITHRKRTMEAAEVLYGVTMPEPGVSKLMSLKLENNVIAREN